jgi:hypothetical protein
VDAVLLLVELNAVVAVDSVTEEELELVIVEVEVGVDVDVDTSAVVDVVLVVVAVLLVTPSERTGSQARLISLNKMTQSQLSLCLLSKETNLKF